jgi:hypothetical protein
MRTIWGPVNEIRDMGVVAEQCPHCVQIMPCLLRSVCRGNYVFFMKTTAPIGENSCLCTVCLKAFPCEYWRYAGVVSIREAKALAVEELLARTNPGLAERLELKEHISALGCDARFAVAYEQLDGMRPGVLRSTWLKQLLDWDRLTVEQRTLLVEQIGAQSRAWQFARQVAPAFPGQTGCLTAALAALVVWSAFLWAPPVRSWLWGSVTVVAGFGAAALTSRVLLKRRIFQWMRKVLIPEAQDASVSLTCFLAVVEDVPESRLCVMEELWPVKVELQTIRGLLIAEGKLRVSDSGNHVAITR